MKILRLHITGDWLNEIDAGRKTDEYREIKQHYISRFFTPVQRDLRDLFQMVLYCAEEGISIHRFGADFGCKRKDFDAVELIAGYSRTSRRSLYELRGLTVGRGREEWGAPTDRKRIPAPFGPQNRNATMTKQFKPRRNIERATAFKVVCAVIASEDGNQEREFQNLKSMRQWIDRNGELFGLLVLNTLALIDGKWEPFTVIGNKTITLSDLEKIVRDLREDYKPSEIEK